MKTNQDKIIHALSFITWVIVGAIVINFSLYAYFLNFHDRPSITWSNNPFPTLTPIVKSGDPINFLVKRCSKSSYVARVNREIVDGLAYIVPQETIIFEKGCVTENRLIPEVTKNLPAGTYHIRSMVEVDEYWLWFSRVDKYETNTQNFTVIRPHIDPHAETTSQ